MRWITVYLEDLIKQRKQKFIDVYKKAVKLGKVVPANVNAENRHDDNGNLSSRCNIRRKILKRNAACKCRSTIRKVQSESKELERTNKCSYISLLVWLTHTFALKFRVTIGLFEELEATTQIFEI